MIDCVFLLKDAGRGSLGRAAQQQEGRCVQMHCRRGEELKLQQSESRWEKQAYWKNQLPLKEISSRSVTASVYLSQARLRSRTSPKTWGILTWEWRSLQTHLMASWYVAPTLRNKTFYFCYIWVACGYLKGCGETRLCLLDRILMNQLCWCVFIWL